MTTTPATVQPPSKEAPTDVRSLITKMKDQFGMALPKHITPERFMRIALTAVNKTPKLLACTKESLLACLMDLSQMGLEPDGRKAHLIPYGNACTLIVDYKGLVDLARRSGEISYIHADVACENDTFEFCFGSGASLKHVPAAGDRGKVTHAYSFVKLKDGSEDFDVMTKEDIEKVRKRSKAGSNGPWVTDWNEMAKKTIFRRHSKWLPVSSEKFKDAIEKDGDIPIDLIPTGTELPELPKAQDETQVVPEGEGVASQNQKEIMRKMGRQAGYETDEAFIDFLTGQKIADPDNIPLADYHRILQVLMVEIDKHSKKSDKKS